MKTGLNTQAYTIVEVMIVLAVTGALLVMVMAFISGKQGRTEFAQSVNDIQAQISDVINNVSTGYYANGGNYQCTDGGSGPAISDPGGPSTNNTGENKDCVFMGRAMQFAVGGDLNAYNLYSIVGLRQSSGKDVTKYSEAQPTAIATGTKSPQSGFPDGTEHLNLLYGLTAKTMKYVDGGTDTPIGTVAFISSLATRNALGYLNSGSQQVDLVPVKDTIFAQPAPEAVDKIDSLKDDASTKNPSGGVIICFESGGSSQHANITIGGNGRSLSTKVDISGGGCS